MSTPTPIPPPGTGAKPLRADAARNRAKILDAARDAFAQDGRDAQMDDVARRAGVGVGTVYRHFPTKESLALAIVEQRFDRIIAEGNELLRTDPDPWRVIERSFELCATTQLTDRGYADAVAAIAAASTAHGPLGPPPQQLLQLIELSTTMVERARAAGVVRADLQPSDMPPLYAGLASVVQAGVPDWRRYMEIMLDGLRPR
ncbi:TetR/AcrR family transcriptional regulator [Conexibacter sp. CPCC 206217]|uniref:TetR/AcrR family transcriptional regulator n=1 Tax=Conexibacter sp. CPCC 206217 TaxID=3064574 RepID=UPI00271BE748|nr:TetR/AcrR family transcriptional regulator [Conexibacter sp. CPCC 206217]MDO8212943.1 helix-turn-helix domain-containing protein [Conexibacter sp. CPCC 206217]